MHAEYINAELRRKGHPAIRIAERLDVWPSAVSGVINGNARSLRIAREVSRVIGKPVSELWPGAYEAPRRRRRVRRGQAA
jgi:lambda repressor-like predicted transcriptional regulator